MQPEVKKNLLANVKVRRNFIVLSVLLPVVLGLIAGVAGELLSRAYITDDAYSPPFWREVDLSNDYRGSNLVIRDAKKVVVEQDVKVAETINSVSGSIVGIFKKQLSPSKESSGFNTNQFYKMDQNLGSGLIITSDGWILCSSIAGNSAQIISDHVVITKDKKIYNIDKVVKDPVSSSYFIHIAGVKDLPVRQFAERSEISNGQLAIAADWLNDGWLTSLIKSGQNSSIISSETVPKNIILAETPANLKKGAIVFNLSGNIAGFADKDGIVIPINSYSSAMKSLLKDGIVKRPYLGINYIDLSVLAPIKASGLKKEYSQGVIIYEKDGVPGVIKGSPADLAGILTGDVIISLNDIELKQGTDLREQLENFVAGDKIKLRIDRKGELKDVEIKLGELK